MSVADPAGEAVPVKTSAGAQRGVSRRTVLGAAVAGGTGVAAIRLWGGSVVERLGPGVSSPATAGRGDWVSPLDSPAARVTHLLRRATFGFGADEVENALSAGFAKTVDRLLESPPQAPPAFGDAADASRFARLNAPQLVQWWINHILTTPTPFAERMTLYWHGHFTSDYRKVGLQTPFIYWQNLTWRAMALTDLRSMLMRVTSDPAMLRYLDLGTSTGSSPNENYSRELMELFTMGPGAYSEDDVRAGAKALAGWTFPQPDGSVDITLDPKNNVTRKYGTYSRPMVGVFNPKRAYNGQVTFLKKTAKFDTQMVLDQILAQPATAPFVVTRLLQHFAGNNPSKAWVTRLADQFRKSRWDVKTLIRGIFTSPEFVSAQSYRALVRSPIEYMVSASKALGADAATATKLIASSSQNMGQVLFDPPDVGGWPNNEAWISSNSVIARVNFATALVNAVKQPPAFDESAIGHQLEGVLSPQTATAINQASDDRSRWFLLLASPEFQLK
jgi:uncharacterized protein (DUF1800 family)